MSLVLHERCYNKRLVKNAQRALYLYTYSGSGEINKSPRPPLYPNCYPSPRVHMLHLISPLQHHISTPSELRPDPRLAVLPGDLLRPLHWVGRDRVRARVRAVPPLLGVEASRLKNRYPDSSKEKGESRVCRRERDTTMVRHRTLA
jgi:hypothetical protein